MIPVQDKNFVPLAFLPPTVVAKKLRAMGEPELADEIESHVPQTPQRDAFFELAGLFQKKPKPWQYTAHAFGFLPINVAEGTPLISAGSIDPDTDLRNGRVTIRLDGLHAADYPGSGLHEVLFQFSVRNQVPNGEEDLHFNTTLRVQERQSAGMTGMPVFVGLNISSEGVSLQCQTINVKNANDKAFLECLNSDAVRSGLKLITTAQPAIAPLSSIALAIAKSFAKRNENAVVQSFDLGLDFTPSPTGARLSEGCYIAAQLPDDVLNEFRWSDWHISPNTGMIRSTQDLAQVFPFNYIIIRVTRFQE